MYLDPFLFDLGFQILHEGHDIFGFQVLHYGCHGQQSTKIGSLLIQRHVVTPFCRHPRRLHARRAATDHQHLFLLLGRRKGESGIEFPAERRVGPAFEAAVPVTDVKTVQTTVAPADILQPARGNLVGQFRIGQQTAGHADEIEAPLTQKLFAQFGVHTAGGPDRDIFDLLLDRFGKDHGGAFALHAPVQIHGIQVRRGFRVEEPVRLQQASAMAVSFGTAVDAVCTGIGYTFCHFDTFGDGCGPCWHCTRRCSSEHER